MEPGWLMEQRQLGRTNAKLQPGPGRCLVRPWRRSTGYQAPQKGEAVPGPTKFTMEVGSVDPLGWKQYLEDPLNSRGRGPRGQAEVTEVVGQL